MKPKAYYEEKATFYLTASLKPQLMLMGALFDNKSMEIGNPKDLYYGNVKIDLYKKFFPKSKRTGEIEHMDIMSPKVKVLLSFEYSRPFEDKLYAVNEEAISRREEEEFNKVQEYTIRSIMSPIEAMLSEKYAGQDPEKVSEQIQAELQQITPKRIAEYMQREHQDIADIAGNQVLEFLKKHIRLKNKFDDGLLEAALTKNEIYRIFNDYGHPNIELLDGSCIDYIKSPYSDFIEDADVVKVKYSWTEERLRQEIKLSDTDLSKIRELKKGSIIYPCYDVTHSMWRDVKTAIKVWKKDDKDNYQIVDSDYKLITGEEYENVEVEVIHQAYMVENIYLVGYGEYMVGDNTYRLKMPYYGKEYKDWFLKRMFKYQIIYNVLNEHMLMLLKRNKGKKMAIDPTRAQSKGIDIAKFIEYLNEEDLIFINTKQEGERDSQAVSTMVQSIDMSHASDIQQIQSLLEYIDYKAGESVGVPKQMEAQIQEREGVKNVDKVFGQTLKLLEPYFKDHDEIKNRVTIGLINLAQKIYKNNPPKVLSYILDDISFNWIKFSSNTFTTSTYGLFLQNTSMTLEKKNMIDGYMRLYTQNPNAKMSTIIEVTNIHNPTSALSRIKAEEYEQEKKAENQARQTHARNMELEQLRQKGIKEQFIAEKDLVVTKEKERRITEIYKSAITAMGFPGGNTDANGNSLPDVIDQAKIILKEREVAVKEALANSQLEKTEESA